MANDRGIHPPPVPSTPKDAPWEDLQTLIKRLDKLIEIMSSPVIPGAPSVRIFGAPGAAGTVGQLITVMQDLVPESLGKSEIIPFQKTVAVSRQEEQDRQIPFTGTVRDVIMAFPAGCHQLVEVRLVYLPKGGSYKYVVPTIDSSFVALDDFTVMFSPRFLVKSPGNLRVEWWNYDSLNSHTVPVIVTLAHTNLEVVD